MRNDLSRKIRTALKCKRPPYSVIQQPDIQRALDAIAHEISANREEVIWRAIRVYLNAYLHTHTERWLNPEG